MLEVSKAGLAREKYLLNQIMIKKCCSVKSSVNVHEIN
jgi:hypothetical protein